MRCYHWPILLTIGLFAGCQGDASSTTNANAPRFGPHGGALIALPGETGFAEVLSEATATTSRSGMSVISAYFLNKDLTAPLPSPPTEARVQLQTPDKPEPLELVLAPEANKDKLGAGRLASKAGSYQFDPLVGKLETTVGGQAISADFSTSR